jgi:hypothetical protein
VWRAHQVRILLIAASAEKFFWGIFL